MPCIRSHKFVEASTSNQDRLVVYCQRCGYSLEQHMPSAKPIENLKNGITAFESEISLNIPEKILDKVLMSSIGNWC